LFLLYADVCITIHGVFKYVLSTMGVSKESISKILIGNRFHVKLRILSPRKSCMQRLRVAYNFGCRGLYNLPWRASVSSHQVQCNIPTFEALLRKYTYLFLERCRKSNNIWLLALMQLDCLYSSLFFEHYNRVLLGELVIELCSIHLIDGMSCHMSQCFRILPRLDRVRN